MRSWQSAGPHVDVFDRTAEKHVSFALCAFQTKKINKLLKRKGEFSFYRSDIRQYFQTNVGSQFDIGRERNWSETSFEQQDGGVSLNQTSSKCWKTANKWVTGLQRRRQV